MPEQVYMYFKPRDVKRFLWAMNRLWDNVDRQAHGELPRKMAYEYRNILYEAIVGQKHVGGWGARAKRYSPRYKAWQMEVMTVDPGFWRLRGDLIKELKVFPLLPSQMSGAGSRSVEGRLSRRSSSSIGAFTYFSPRRAGPGGSGRSGAYLGGPKRKMYMVGWKGGAFDSGGKSWWGKKGDLWGPSKPVSMYDRILEFGGDFTSSGGGRHPARPMMSPTLVGFTRREGRMMARTTLRWIGSVSWR
ncbi:MAG: hypothetical protein ACXABN_19385 [Candidatus Thorarchaeota archaeon]